MPDDDDILEEPSALNLEISGSVGMFAVQPKGGGSSIPVHYIQTHVGFSLEDLQQQRLFESLVPVREIFGPRDLDFDELMQRDIDDARVSSSLIPYLLQLGSDEQVKFFPPIVTAVIPIDGEKRLLSHYPKVIEHSDETKITRRRMTSGPPGAEVFEFEQVERNGKLREFDNARLRLNTSLCKIVIVDGQHRAMALLALHRNVKGWPDKTAAFKDFYKRWSKDVLRDNLRGVSLPVVVCVFPTLDGRPDYRSRVVEACRSVFLALNKNARPVSTARNILLDDSDVVAHFARRLLSRVKDLDINSPTALRLWGFELDADEDKVQLNATVAISGVMHVFFLLERLLLSPDTPEGMSVPRRNFWLQKNLDPCLRRLDGYNLLGTEVAQTTNRNAFARDALAKLIESFDSRYGKLLVDGFQTFWPFDAMAQAALDLEVKVRNNADMQCHAMLFEGQGIQRVFESYVENLDSELSEKFPDGAAPPELKAILGDFRGTAARLRGFRDEFAKLRAKKFFAKLRLSEAKTTDVLVKAVTELFKTVFTTAAFQAAFYLTFFTLLEKHNKVSRQHELVLGDEKDAALFTEYVEVLNDWFRADDDDGARRLFGVFSGKATGSVSAGSLKIAESVNTLRKIVIAGELKPDEWVKFRYLILEMWSSKDPDLEQLIGEAREKCRHDVIRSFNTRRLREYCEEKGIDVADMTPKARDRVTKDSVESYIAGLELLRRATLGADEKDKIAGYVAPPPPADSGGVPTE